MKARLFGTVAVATLLLSSEANAGRLVTAPLVLLTGQTGVAQIANVGKSTLTDVRVVCHNNFAAIVVNASSAGIEPNMSFGPGLPTGPGTFRCEFTAKQGKGSMRALIQNLTTGAVSEAR